MHAIWDMPITFGSSIHLIQILLCIIVITVVLILLSSGLRQVSLIADKARKNIRDSFPNMAYNTDENDIREGRMMSKYCEQCGTELEDNAMFCPSAERNAIVKMLK